METLSMSISIGVVFVSIFDSLCVVGGARLACCSVSWLHTRWCFSLVPDPIIHAPWWVLLKGLGVKML